MDGQLLQNVIQGHMGLCSLSRPSEFCVTVSDQLDLDVLLTAAAAAVLVAKLVNNRRSYWPYWLLGQSVNIQLVSGCSEAHLQAVLQTSCFARSHYSTASEIRSTTVLQPGAHSP